MAYRISEACVGCGACKKQCPWEAIFGEKKKRHVIDPTLCKECSTCWWTCPRYAVEDPEGYCRQGGKPRAPKACIDGEHCVGCQTCLCNCEQQAIEYEKGLLTGRCVVDQTLCVGCASCRSWCPNDCIEVRVDDDR